MPEILKDGRRHWTADEVEFLSNPDNLRTAEQHKAAHDLQVAMELNFLIDCILDDRDPITGRSITEEEQELMGKGPW